MSVSSGYFTILLMIIYYLDSFRTFLTKSLLIISYIIVVILVVLVAFILVPSRTINLDHYISKCVRYYISTRQRNNIVVPLFQGLK